MTSDLCQLPPSLLITGASSGIGAACAALLAERGQCSLILHGRDTARLQAVLDSLPGSGHRCIEGDVVDWMADPSSIPELPPLNGIIWSAGICELLPGNFLIAKALRRSLVVNLEAPLFFISHCYRKKILCDGSTVVLLGSQSAHDAGEGFSAYAASKAGLAAAVRVLNKEYHRRNIQLKCIEPATVDTPMTERLIEQFGQLKDTPKESIRSAKSVAKEVVASF